jgi:hypothetical protein
MTGSKIIGAHLEPIPDTSSVLNWIFSNEKPSIAPDNDWHAVLQCSDAYVWGIWRGEKWVWASDECAEVRAPRKITLQEARIFSPSRELLVWRVGEFYDETFACRVLTDAPDETSEWKPIERHHEFWKTTAASNPQPMTNFIERRNEGGQVVITPPGTSLLVKQYIEEDDTQASLRIAAIRFVSIVEES